MLDAVLRSKFGLLLSLALIYAACPTAGVTGTTQTPERIMSEGENFAKVTLNGKATKDKNRLVIEYTVRNNLPHSIYVFDQMIKYDDTGKPELDPTTAYCFWEEPKTLRLVRAILRIPLEKDIYSLEIPYAREIKPQSEVSGKIELDVPVKEKSPFYAFPGEDNAKSVECDRIRLLIGWTEFREGTQITEATVSGEKVLRVRGSWKPYLVQDEYMVPVTVTAHVDTFDRQMPQN